MITVGVTLQNEPKLRQALMDAGMEAVGRMAGHQRADAASPSAPAMPDLSVIQALMAQAQVQGQLQIADPALTAAESPQNGVKINRFGGSSGTSQHFQRVPSSREPAPDPHAGDTRIGDTQRMAEQLGQMLKGLKIGQ